MWLVFIFRSCDLPERIPAEPVRPFYAVGCLLGKTSGWTQRRLFHRIGTFPGKPARKPGIDPPGERPDSRDSLFLQQERHPGACRFIGSRAVEDNLAIAGNFLVAFFKLFDSHMKRARDHIRDSLDIERMSQVHNHNLIPRG